MIEASADAPPARPDRGVSHNLLGQRLGRKGQETRERILCAALSLLEADDDTPITLTRVARQACVGMTTLYLYFPDLGDVALAALQRVMDSADDAFVAKLRARWPDDRLEECCLDFLRAHLRFWQAHARVLHLRNSFADASDLRFLEYRNQVSLPLLDLLIQQMSGASGETHADRAFLASVLLTGFERIATVVTNANWHLTMHDFARDQEVCYLDRLLRSEARLMSLAIARERAGG